MGPSKSRVKTEALAGLSPKDLNPHLLVTGACSVLGPILKLGWEGVAPTLLFEGASPGRCWLILGHSGQQVALVCRGHREGSLRASSSGRLVFSSG